MDMTNDNSLFLVVPVPVRMVDGQILMESQSLHGLDMYAENFDHVTAAFPVLPESMVQDFHWDWTPADKLKHSDRIRMVTLPWAYAPLDHLSSHFKVRRLLDENIKQHRYLQFAIGGLFGDWGGLACYRAHKQGRRYAIWADRVEHRVIAETQNDGWKRKLKNALTIGPMRRFEKHVVERASVGLFNGNETWSYYQQFNANSHQVHDIHTQASQYISEEDLSAKLERIKQGEPLKICYMGRVSAMKAPLQWLEAVHLADEKGVEFEAIWMGDGDLMDEAKAKISEWNLQDKVTMAGFVSDHEYVLKTMQTSDIFLFTHVTPESPRCLIETMVSGTPMVGYRSDYSNNLTQQHGGGVLVEINDVKGLSEKLVELDKDRERLVSLTKDAAKNGLRFSDVEAFAERADLIKRFS